VMDKSGAGAGFLRELRFPLLIYIPSASPQSSSLSPEAGTKKNTALRIIFLKSNSASCFIDKSAIYFSYTGVPGGKVNILKSHSIGHSKQVSYSERFPR
jgi:hypothetical protein